MSVLKELAKEWYVKSMKSMYRAQWLMDMGCDDVGARAYMDKSNAQYRVYMVLAGINPRSIPTVGG
jgi:hypothetical protein